MERRLAAILSADVAGYSRLMEEDEAGTLAALKERQRTIIEPLVAEHQGRIVKLMGDGFLIAFEMLDQAFDLAKRAVALDENNYTCQAVMGLRGIG
jgi:adenylate cyclase